MRFTAMTVHLEIDYLLNTCSWKIIANGAPIKKRIILPLLRFNDHLGGTTVKKGPACTGRGPKRAGTVPPPQDFYFNHWMQHFL